MVDQARARKLAKRLVPTLGLPLAALACVTGAAPLSLRGPASDGGLDAVVARE